MSDNFGSIGDAFPDREIKCRVKNCKNLVRISGKKAMLDIARGKSRPERMCDECYERLQTLEDKEMPCSRPGCDGKWVWSRYQQLEAAVGGRENFKPRGFCPKCLEEIKATEDKEFPCRIKGCKNTWKLTAREQMENGDKPVQRKLCDDCYRLLMSLKDMELKCRIEGCGHTIIWNRFQQLEYIRSGKSLDNPPARMCNDCFEIFKTLKPRTAPCRIRGCNNTWVYSTYEQLEQIVKARNNGLVQAECTEHAEHPEGECQGECHCHEEPPAPSKMCNECFNFYKNAVDMQVPCRTPGCKNTWTYTRSMQLAQKQYGKTQPPSRYCDECTMKLMSMEDKQMPCQQKNCTGTWTYPKDEQLRDEMAGRQPKQHNCRECAEFLKSTPAQAVECEACKKTFDVTTMQLLQIKLGNSSMPTLCAACAQAKLKAEVPDDNPQNSISRPKIYIPKTGEWLGEAPIRNNPKYLTQELLDKICASAHKFVCLGDEFVLSCEDEASTWTAALENSLRERFDGSLAIYNAGQTGCTTAQCLKRLERDVVPFAPELIILSSSLGDAASLPLNLTDEKLAQFLSELGESIGKLSEAAAGLNAKLLWILPNIPQVEVQSGEEQDFDPRAKRGMYLEKIETCTRRACQAAGIALLDVNEMFLKCGEKTTRSCTGENGMHNASGAAIIANWVRDAINQAMNKMK